MAQLGSLGTEKLSNLPRPHSYKMMESGSEPGSMTPKPLFFPSGSSVTSICCHVGKHTPPTPPSMFMGDFPPHGPTASQRLSPRALLLLGFHSIPTLCLPPQKKDGAVWESPDTPKSRDLGGCNETATGLELGECICRTSSLFTESVFGVRVTRNTLIKIRGS